jgi:basic membrane protein A
MLKRFDRAAYLALAEYADGTLRPRVQRLGLGSGGVGLAFSGGFIDDIRPRLDRLRRRIIAGDIEVPTVPDSRRIERE